MYVLLYCGVCIGVRLLPPGETPIAVRNRNNNNMIDVNVFFTACCRSVWCIHYITREVSLRVSASSCEVSQELVNCNANVHFMKCHNVHSKFSKKFHTAK
jgi:hypothetical protein